VLLLSAQSCRCGPSLLVILECVFENSACRHQGRQFVCCREGSASPSCPGGLVAPRPALLSHGAWPVTTVGGSSTAIAPVTPADAACSSDVREFPLFAPPHDHEGTYTIWLHPSVFDVTRLHSGHGFHSIWTQSTRKATSLRPPKISIGSSHDPKW